LLLNIVAAILFYKGIFTWAALVVIFAGIFDIVDGEVARRTNRVTKFGAFFDSVIDRYSDVLLLLDNPGRRVGVPAKLYEYLGAGARIQK